MFNINIYLKLAIIAVTLIGGTILAFTVGFWYAFPILLIGLGFLASYFLLGTVNSTAQLVQAQDFDGAEKRLAMTKYPKMLYVTNRAMYYIMKGSIALNNKNTDEAEELFNEALALKLPSDDEKAMVLLQLTNINASKGKWTAATNMFRDLKKLSIRSKEIKEQVNQFEKVFKNNKAQMKTARTMGRSGQRMMGGGGKRRRPKAR